MRAHVSLSPGALGLALAMILMQIACVSGCVATPSRECATGFITQSIAVDGVEYRYAVYHPRGLGPEPARGLVFLHGYGECGTDGLKQLGVGLPSAVVWNPERWPFVIVIPQKPEHNREWEDYDRAVLAMLDREILRGAIDRDRVAITGLSQGGHGTIQIAARHPERFRAAVPVCAYVKRAFADGERVENPFPTGARAQRLAQSFATTPVWLFHGESDRVVPVTESTRFHELLEQHGAEAKITVYPGVDHNSWDSAYRESGVWDWLVERTD